VPEESKIKEFPLEKAGGGEEELWKCHACGHKITQRMDEQNVDKSKVLPLNLGGMMIYVCPHCRTLQMPQEVFDEVFKKATSKILT
jgi:DNA-directed RNA polymerase subunit RPC12/RpoP